MSADTAVEKRAARQKHETEKLPPLEAGDHLDQPTFHARYEAMPEGFRAELIGGVVHVPSPLKPPHGRGQVKLIQWVGIYDDATPGVGCFDNTTAILGPDSEPQPDAVLIVLPEYGGQMRYDDEGYLAGAPELIGEVASSTESVDLHRKKDDYERNGVQEYVVVALRQQKVFWFVRRGDRFEEQAPGSDGIIRSEKFPGLWLDPNALLACDGNRLTEVLNDGLTRQEHADFVNRLASAKPS